jgi:uncharacterized protein YndB with AHSA1/START domain
MPRRPMTVSGEVVVAAPPMRLYELVSDPAQMRRWSPENTGADTDGPLAVGDSFVGTNRRGPLRWSSRAVVTAADPGERFAFRVVALGVGTPMLPGPVASWEYRFTAVADGTRVTETWTDDRRAWPDAVVAVFDRIATGGSTFAAFQEGNIRRTLDRLKADVEG